MIGTRGPHDLPHLPPLRRQNLRRADMRQSGESAGVRASAAPGSGAVPALGEALNELALFAGAGGGILGGHLLGWRTVCAVEYEPYAAGVLVARQNDGLLAPFPIWDDVRTFDGRPWRGRVDVVSGGFPCQDISVAGNGAGIDGERSGLWSEMARIVGEVRPRYVFVENSPALVTRGLGRVLGDLAALGYDCRWMVLGAADVGAPHQRDRIWIVANAVRERSDAGEHCSQRGALHDFDGNGAPQERGRHELESWAGRCGEDVAHANPEGLPQRLLYAGSKGGTGRAFARKDAPVGSWWAAEPDVGRVVDGMAARVDRLKAIGNGQVPCVAAAAFAELSARFG